MKYLALLFLLSSNVALASGKLTFKAEERVKKDDPHYSLGLSVNQKIKGPLHYVGWLGGGNLTNHKEDDWYKTTQGVEAYLGALAVGAGATYQTNPKTDNTVYGYYGSVSLTLW